MSQSQPGNPLHGINLEQMLIELVEGLGWKACRQRAIASCLSRKIPLHSCLLDGEDYVTSSQET
jgi:uncharacterized protein (DUF2132 family)